MADAGNLVLDAHVLDGQEQSTGEGMPLTGNLDLTKSISEGADEPPSRFGLAVAASLLVHVCAAWAGVQFAGDHVLGGADFETETISVQIVGAIPSAAAPAETSVATAPPSTPMKLQEPPPKQDRPIPEDPPPAKQISEEEEPLPAKPAEPLPDQSKPDETLTIPNEFPLVLPREPETAELPLPAAEEKRPPKQEKPPPIVEDYPRALPRTNRDQHKKDQKKERKQDADKQRTAVKDQPVEPQAAAAATSAGSPNAPAPTVRKQRVTSASKGALRIFARRIARALARSRPRRMAGRGTVLVAFTISQGGGLASVRVKSSSGNARIDRAAVRAVRRARFPKPPEGATRNQRTFVIPYYFRRR